MAIQTTPTKPQIQITPANGPDGTTFKLIEKPRSRNRIIMSIEGDWGTGKTDFALTAPGPIAFFKIDPNSEFTLDKYVGKKIWQSDIKVPRSDGENAQALSDTVWQQFIKDYTWALANTRSVVWDTATEIWELLRLCKFGKLAQISPQHYTQVNNDFRGLIKLAFDSETNLLMIHKLKDEWTPYTDIQGKERNKKSGKKERAGFGDLGFACQVMVQTMFDRDNEESPFSAKILKCTQNPMLTTNVYSQVGDLRLNSFPFIAADVFPGTGIEVWS